MTTCYAPRPETEVPTATLAALLAANATNTHAVEVLDDGQPALSTYPRCADGNGTLTHLFFADDEFDLARAKSICGKCGLSEQCLTDALERAEPYGVWGGKLLIDGVIVEVKRGRGRPPKQPRQPLVVDEVPLPPHLVA